MPVYSFKHCIFCYKEDPAPAVAAVKKEVCRRFCTLASRYLGLDPFHVASDKTLRSKFEFNMTVICDECVETASSFCDLYEKAELLKIQMNWRIYEMCTIMNEADREGSRNALDKQVLKEKKERVGEGMGAIDEFRKDFLEFAAEKLQSSFPRVPPPAPPTNPEREPEVVSPEESETESDTASELSSDCSFKDDDSCFTVVKRTIPIGRGASLGVPRPRLLDLLDQKLHADNDSDASSDTNDQELIEIQPKATKQAAGTSRRATTPKPQAGNGKQDKNDPPVRHGNRKTKLPARFLDSSRSQKPERTHQAPERKSGPSKRFRLKALPTNLKKGELPPVRRSLRRHQSTALLEYYICPFCDSKNKFSFTFRRHLKLSLKKCLENRPIDFDLKSFDIEKCKAKPKENQ